MASNAPCAETARQREITKCVHRRSTFASMRNTDSESDAKSDADTESVVVDSDVVFYFKNSFYLLLLRSHIFSFIFNYQLFCLKRIHD